MKVVRFAMLQSTQTLGRCGTIPVSCLRKGTYYEAMDGNIILALKCGILLESKMNMFRTDPGPTRAELGFAEAALSAFSFLSSQYDFHLVKVEPTFVRYESPILFVNIYHGRGSFELGFEIGLLEKDSAQKESAFSLGDVLDLLEIREETGYTFLQASTVERVKTLVPTLATLVQNYADPVLRSEAGVFDRLTYLQSKKSDELLKEWSLREVREKAAKAWQERNYSELASLYESISEDLTAAESKKLEYAKKQLPL